MKEARETNNAAPFVNTRAADSGWALRNCHAYNNYLDRALITAIGLGANRPEAAVYPTSLKAADRKPYEGAHK